MTKGTQKWRAIVSFSFSLALSYVSTFYMSHVLPQDVHPGERTLVNQLHETISSIINQKNVCNTAFKYFLIFLFSLLYIVFNKYLLRWIFIKQAYPEAVYSWTPSSDWLEDLNSFQMLQCTHTHTPLSSPNTAQRTDGQRSKPESGSPHWSDGLAGDRGVGLLWWPITWALSTGWFCPLTVHLLSFGGSHGSWF